MPFRSIEEPANVHRDDYKLLFTLIREVFPGGKLDPEKKQIDWNAIAAREGVSKKAVEMRWMRFRKRNMKDGQWIAGATAEIEDAVEGDGSGGENGKKNETAKEVNKEGDGGESDLSKNGEKDEGAVKGQGAQGGEKGHVEVVSKKKSKGKAAAKEVKVKDDSKTKSGEGEEVAVEGEIEAAPGKKRKRNPVVKKTKGGSAGKGEGEEIEAGPSKKPKAVKNGVIKKAETKKGVMKYSEEQLAKDCAEEASDEAAEEISEVVAEEGNEELVSGEA